MNQPATQIFSTQQQIVLSALHKLNYSATISDIATSAGLALSTTRTALDVLESFRYAGRITKEDVHPVRWRVTVAGKMALNSDWWRSGR